MPYVPIDRVCSVDASRATAIKNITFTEDYLATHFPQFPVVPGAMMIDSLLELAGVLLEAAVGEHRGVRLVSVRRARFKRFVRPGDQLEVLAELIAVDREARSATVKGSLRVSGQEVSAIADMVVGWREGNDD
jgi:3-hydroxymyristoyl/3-hydroxydecanoyl-(acyl carrier protein) dehydratase